MIDGLGRGAKERKAVSCSSEECAVSSFSAIEPAVANVPSPFRVTKSAAVLSLFAFGTSESVEACHADCEVITRAGAVPNAACACACACGMWHVACGM
eukprot:4359797-Prymnesium_polylepis.1